MSDAPILSKMDALLKKHRGDGDSRVQSVPSVPGTALSQPPQTARPAAPPNAWLPVLTQVIERGTPPPVAPTPVSLPPADAPAAPLPPAGESAPPIDVTAAPVMDNTLAEQLMTELAPRLSEAMEKQVASELRKNIDQTVATLLSQLDVNVREIVREAIAEKLKHPRDPAA